MWDAAAGDEFVEDGRFEQFLKRTPTGPAWAVTRIKANMRGAFEALEEVEEEDQLWGVVVGWRIAIEACVESIPEWSWEFEDRVNERLREMAIPAKFEVRRATRSMRNVIIGISGAAGGGKTCSSLRLAKGMANGGQIVLIDTEQGKSTEFAPRDGEVIKEEFDPELPLFDYQIIDLPPPHNPERFRLAVNVAARLRPAVLIIDNITDEMHGTGGQLDMKDNAPETDKLGWREPKSQHRALMNTIKQRPWYVILTIRAKEKIRPATVAEKRATGLGVINTGWSPQCDGGLYYDCAMLQLVDNGIPNGSEERPWKLPPSLRRHLVPGQPFDENVGRRIAEWCQPQGAWVEEE